MVSDQEEVNDMYRIMLVEDDATIVDILSRQLEKWGYLVRAVQDFDRVMEEFREFQPQLRRGVLPLRRRRTARLPGSPVHCAPRS